MLVALMHLFKAMLGSHLDDLATVQRVKVAGVNYLLESIFIFSYVWSVGATSISSTFGKHFDEFFRHALNGTLPAYTSPTGNFCSRALVSSLARKVKCLQKNPA